MDRAFPRERLELFLKMLAVPRLAKKLQSDAIRGTARQDIKQLLQENDIQTTTKIKEPHPGKLSTQRYRSTLLNCNNRNRQTLPTCAKRLHEFNSIIFITSPFN